MMNSLDISKLAEVEVAARYLLGCKVIRTLDDGTRLAGKIVEVEAYHQTDPASHTFHGKSERNRAMFGPPAHAYIYFTYGMHYCFNITAGREREGAGVLIRAIEPLEGIDNMMKNRNCQDLKRLTNGPAKLAQALAIDKKLYGHDLTKPPLQVVVGDKLADNEIVQTTRIGIKRGVDTTWRFYIINNSFVSKP